jgi:hypothetical protein
MLGRLNVKPIRCAPYSMFLIICIYCSVMELRCKIDCTAEVDRSYYLIFVHSLINFDWIKAPITSCGDAATCAQCLGANALGCQWCESLNLCHNSSTHVKCDKSLSKCGCTSPQFHRTYDNWCCGSILYKFFLWSLSWELPLHVVWHQLLIHCRREDAGRRRPLHHHLV